MALKSTRTAPPVDLEVFQAFWATSTDAFFALDAEQRYVWVNPAGATLLGLYANAVTGKTHAELWQSHRQLYLANSPFSAVWQAMAADIAQIFATATGRSHRYPIVSETGVRVIETAYTPVCNAIGKIVQLVGVSRQISELPPSEWQHFVERLAHAAVSPNQSATPSVPKPQLRQLEQLEQLEQYAESLQRVLDHLPQSIFWKDRDGIYQGCNRRWAEMVGLDHPRMAIGLTDAALPETAEQTAWDRQCDQQVLETNTPMLRMGQTQLQAHGSPIWHETSKFPLHDAEGNVIGLLGMSEAIADRRAAEALLRRSEAQAMALAWREAILNQLSNQIRNSLDLDTILMTAVTEIREFLQVDRCTFSWFKPQPASFNVVYESHNANLPSLLGHYVIGLERATALTNPFLHSALSLEPHRIDDVEGDLTLHPSARQMLRRLGITAQVILPIQTRTGQIGLFNCAYSSGARAWSQDEIELLKAIANQCAIAIDQAALYEQMRLSAQQAQAQTQQLEQTLQTLQKAQAQLIQTEKMSSLGQLVAGVAHEINNPVNFIHGNINYTASYVQDLLDLLDLYQDHYPQPVAEVREKVDAIDLDFLREDLPKTLSSMKMGADRIRQIVLSLRTFSRLNEAEQKPVDIHEGIESTLLILQNQIKARPGQREIQLVRNYGDLPPVECFPGELNQVFMNILSNAIAALRQQESTQLETGCHSEQGTIVIQTGIENLANLTPAVLIQIRDNGTGIPETVQPRLFDPFFTTKPVGQGTGLGLSISHQIVVEKHGGSLRCISEPGAGAEFQIRIPLCRR